MEWWWGWEMLAVSLTQMVKCRKEDWWLIFLLPEKLLSSFAGKITWLFSLVF